MVAQNCNSEIKTTSYKLHALYSFIAGYHDTHVIAALFIVESLTNAHTYACMNACMPPARTHAYIYIYIHTYIHIYFKFSLHYINMILQQKRSDFVPLKL